MIPDRNMLLTEAVRIINQSGSGLFTTSHPTHGPHVWIGMPVLTGDARRLVSFVPDGSDLLRLIRPGLRVTWRFLGEANRPLLIVEGAPRIVSPLPHRLFPPTGGCATPHPPATTAIVTEVESLLHILPEDCVSCRVVLPPCPEPIQPHPAVERAKRLAAGRTTTDAQLRLPF